MLGRLFYTIFRALVDDVEPYYHPSQLEEKGYDKILAKEMDDFPRSNDQIEYVFLDLIPIPAPPERD